MEKNSLVNEAQGNALKLVTGEAWRAQGVGVGEGRFMGESERMPVPGELRARANTSLQHCTLSGLGVVAVHKYGSDPCSSNSPTYPAALPLPMHGCPCIIAMVAGTAPCREMTSSTSSAVCRFCGYGMPA